MPFSGLKVARWARSAPALSEAFVARTSRATRVQHSRTRACPHTLLHFIGLLSLPPPSRARRDAASRSTDRRNAASRSIDNRSVTRVIAVVIASVGTVAHQRARSSSRARSATGNHSINEDCEDECSFLSHLCADLASASNHGVILTFVFMYHPSSLLCHPSPDLIL